MSWAVITGASSGIGLHYAIALARDHHYNVVLVSNQKNELYTLAQSLSQSYGVQTRTLCLNLAQTDAAEQVHDYCATEQLDTEVLINNAGMLLFQPLCEADMARVETLLLLHVVTLTKLCRLFGADMMHRTGNNKGYILNMSSMSAWMAMPGIQCYNASKSFVLNFSKSYWYEMRHRGVHVLAMTPGSTDTGLLPFPPAMARVLRVLGITMSPERLVQRALHVLFETKRKRCMPGAWNYIIVPIINHLPDWLVFAVMKRLPLFSTCYPQK